MDYASLFSGLDEASVSDSLPKHTDGDFTLKVDELKIVDGQNGLAFVIECEIQTSTNEDFPAGTRSSVVINGLKSDNKTKKQIAQGNLKGFLAAALHLDPDSQQNWVGIATMMVDKGLLSGALFCDTAQTAETNPKDKTATRFKFVKHSYRPCAENPRTLVNIVAELQAGQAA